MRDRFPFGGWTGRSLGPATFVPLRARFNDIGIQRLVVASDIMDTLRPSPQLTCVTTAWYARIWRSLNGHRRRDKTRRPPDIKVIP